jgi:tetratricopeptide (TPR) repeat protein
MFKWLKRNVAPGATSAPDHLGGGGHVTGSAGAQTLPASDFEPAAEAAKNRGNAFLHDGNLDQAAQCYREALRLSPAYAEASVNLGIVFARQQRYAEAEVTLLQAISRKLTLWQAHLHLGIVLHEQCRFDEAIASYQSAIALRPEIVECHWRAGMSYLARKQFQSAIDSFERAIALDSHLPEIQTNLGLALLSLGRLDEALSRFTQAISMCDHHVTRHLAGVTCQRLRLWKPAIAHFDRALALAPDYHAAHYQIAFALLLQGDYERGLAHFERRLFMPADMEWLKPIRDAMACFGVERYWRGNSLAGKQLLVLTEQGLGDSLMMLRYIPLLKDAMHAARLHVVCDAPLARLFRALPAVDDVTVKPATLRSDGFDWYCTMMSLPHLFGSRLENIPAAPYLRIPEHEKSRWARRLDSVSGLKVGIAWAGNRKLDTDAARSLALREFEPLMALPSITWVSLQQGKPAAQLKEVDWPILDWMDECHDLQDTGALMESLDLIITVDTAVVHLAGALGRPTWLLNRYDSEWRWLLDREDSPWYSSVRIFRQYAVNDWATPIRQIERALGAQGEGHFQRST